MKIFKGIAVLSLILMSGLVFRACEDKEAISRMEEEKRYFDLFVSSHYPELSPRESGLYIYVVEEGTGISPDADDWMLVNYVVTSIPSNRTVMKVLDTYYENVARENGIYYSGVLYGSYKFQRGNEVKALKEGFSTMKEGGKSRFIFKSDLGYGGEGTDVINPYTSLIYDIHLMKVIPDIESYELGKINDYLDTIPESKITGIYDEETGATLYYIEDKQGTGIEIARDTVVNVIYRGYFSDKRVFDSNIGGDTLKVVVGANEVITGWDIGLTYFRTGGKGRLVVPYQLAYGEAGKLNYMGKVTIPPCETLIFDMEVLEFVEEELSE